MGEIDFGDNFMGKCKNDTKDLSNKNDDNASDLINQVLEGNISFQLEKNLEGQLLQLAR